MAVLDSVDRFQRRHAVFGFPLAVVYKFVDDFGIYLAALLTYYAFLSIFPLLLLLSTILSVVLSSHPEWQQDILDSTLSQIPVLQSAVGDPNQLSGGPVGVVVGSLLALYGALGVGNALQYAMNTIWAIPRNTRPNPFLLRARSMLLIGTAGLAALGVTIISAITASAQEWGSWTRALSLGLTLVLNTGILILAFRIGVRGAPPGHQLAGAMFAAVGLQFLQTYGLVFVARVIAGASIVTGVFALVIGLLSFIYVAAILVVLSAEVNAVGSRRLYPRALLTPFTDNVDLTEADKAAYASQARATRLKGYERIEVIFDRGRRRD
ncbi:MAG: YihY/virulence factor BrkB family protein [Nostocoides sp.]